MGQLILIGIFKLVIFGLASMIRWRKLAEYEEKVEEDDEKDSKKAEGLQMPKRVKKPKENSEEEKKPEEKKSIASRIKYGCFWLILLVDHRTGLAFYWAVFNSMQVDLFLGSWASFKALSFSNF